MYTLVFFVPVEQSEEVKAAVFAAGAGAIGNYDCCCFQTEGTGQWRPLPGSTPYLGSLGKLEKAREARIELVVRDELIRKVLDALLDAHPYEEPAYYIYRTLTSLDFQR